MRTRLATEHELALDVPRTLASRMWSWRYVFRPPVWRYAASLAWSPRHADRRVRRTRFDFVKHVAQGSRRFPVKKTFAWMVCLCIAGIWATGSIAQGRPRARQLGVAPGIYPTGPLNAITDVAGVRVGHTTVIEGDDVRTGVTAVRPHGGNLFQDKVAGAVFVGNAF